MSDPYEAAIGTAAASRALAFAIIEELVQNNVLPQRAWTSIVANALSVLAQTTSLSEEARAYGVAALGAGPRGAADQVQ